MQDLNTSASQDLSQSQETHAEELLAGIEMDLIRGGLDESLEKPFCGALTGVRMSLIHSQPAGQKMRAPPKSTTNTSLLIMDKLGQFPTGLKFLHPQQKADRNLFHRSVRLPAQKPPGTFPQRVLGASPSWPSASFSLVDAFMTKQKGSNPEVDSS